MVEYNKYTDLKNLKKDDSMWPVIQKTTDIDAKHKKKG